MNTDKSKKTKSITLEYLNDYYEIPEYKEFEAKIAGLDNEQKMHYFGRICNVPRNDKRWRTKARYWSVMSRLRAADLWELASETRINEGLPAEREMGIMLGLHPTNRGSSGRSRQGRHSRINATGVKRFRQEAERIEETMQDVVGISGEYDVFDDPETEWGYDPSWAALADSLRYEAGLEMLEGDLDLP